MFVCTPQTLVRHQLHAPCRLCRGGRILPSPVRRLLGVNQGQGRSRGFWKACVELPRAKQFSGLWQMHQDWGSRPLGRPPCTPEPVSEGEEEAGRWAVTHLAGAGPQLPGCGRPRVASPGATGRSAPPAGQAAPGPPLRSPSLCRDVTVAPSRSPRCLIAQLRRGPPQSGELPAWRGRAR